MANPETANDAGPNTIEVGKPMPYFCQACQAIPRAGFCRLAGCPTAPATEASDVRQP